MKTGSIFELLGPIMVGPSSSHTAGAVRLGLMARKILGSPVQKALIILHGSFAETGKGHGTHPALVAGLMGMQPDDERIRFASALAEQAGIGIQFQVGYLGEVHPNSVKFELVGEDQSQVATVGSSIGGGRVLITAINEFTVEITGEYPTLILLYADSPGMVAKITSILAKAKINIAQMKVSREGRGKKALAMIETDETIDAPLLLELQTQPELEKVLFIDALV